MGEPVSAALPRVNPEDVKLESNPNNLVSTLVRGYNIVFNFWSYKPIWMVKHQEALKNGRVWKLTIAYPRDERGQQEAVASLLDAHPYLQGQGLCTPIYEGASDTEVQLFEFKGRRNDFGVWCFGWTRLNRTSDLIKFRRWALNSSSAIAKKVLMYWIYAQLLGFGLSFFPNLEKALTTELNNLGKKV